MFGNTNAWHHLEIKIKANYLLARFMFRNYQKKKTITSQNKQSKSFAKIQDLFTCFTPMPFEQVSQRFTLLSTLSTISEEIAMS